MKNKHLILPSIIKALVHGQAVFHVTGLKCISLAFGLGSVVQYVSLVHFLIVSVSLCPDLSFFSLTNTLYYKPA